MHLHPALFSASTPCRGNINALRKLHTLYSHAASRPQRHNRSKAGCSWQVAPASNRPAVLPDGSYATQVAAVDSFTVATHGAGLSSTNLR